MTDTTTNAPAPATAPASVDDWSEIDATMAEVVDDIRSRDDEGEDTAQEPVEAAETAETPEGEDTPAEPEEAAEEAPSDAEMDIPPEWTAEMKEVFKSLPENARKYVRDRERTLHGKLSEQGRIISTLRPVGETLERYRHTFETRGLAPQQAVEKLLEVQDRLDRDPVNTIKQIADMYKVDLNRVFGAGSRTQQDGSRPAPENAESAALEHEIASLKQQLQAIQAETAQEKSARVAREMQETQANVEKWSADKPHFEKVRQTMARLINAGEAADLDSAYAKALRLDEELSEQIEAEKAEKAAKLAAEKAAKEAEAAKKRKKLNVGKPGDRTTPDLSMMDDMDRIGREILARG